jgi:hypothetical protein
MSRQVPGAVPGGVILATAFCPQPPLLVPELAAGAAPELAGLRAACDEAVRRMLAAGPQRLYVLGAGPRPACYPYGGLGTMAGFGVDVSLRLGSPLRGRSGPAVAVSGRSAPVPSGSVRPVPAATVAGRGLPAPLAAPGLGEASPDAAGELPLPLGLGGWLLERAGAYLPVVGVLAGPGGELPPLELAGPAGLLVMGDGSACRDGRSPGYPDPRAVPYDEAVTVALATGDPAALCALDVALGARLLAAGAPVWRAAGALLAGGWYDAEVLYAEAPYGVGYLVAGWRRR